MGGTALETNPTGLKVISKSKWKCPTCKVWITKEPIAKQCSACKHAEK